MATRVTHKIMYLDDNESKIIPHLDGASVFPLNVQFTGGGNNRYIVNFIVLETVPEEEGTT